MLFQLIFSLIWLDICFLRRHQRTAFAPFASRRNPELSTVALESMGHKYTKIVGSDEPGEACLFLGSIDWVVEDDILEDLGITAIVSVLPTQPQYAGEVLEKHNIPTEDYMVYPLEDNADEYISLFTKPGAASMHSKERPPPLSMRHLAT